MERSIFQKAAAWLAEEYSAGQQVVGVRKKTNLRGKFEFLLQIHQLNIQNDTMLKGGIQPKGSVPTIFLF